MCTSGPFHEIGFYPPKGSPRHPGLARTVHFLDDGKSIMTGFLDSKDLYSWTLLPWRENWHAKLSTRIGNTAWSAATRLLLVWNLVDGIDVYHIVERPVLVRKLRVNISRMYVCQVDFGCQGLLATSGTDKGKVCIWNMNSAEQSTVLTHGHGMLLHHTTYKCLLLKLFESRRSLDPDRCSKFFLDKLARLTSPMNRQMHSLVNGCCLLASASSEPTDKHPVIKVWVSNGQLRKPSTLGTLFRRANQCIDRFFLGMVIGILSAFALYWLL
ncbi:hypothetical protein BKA83DRAFT_4054058 [Pisolithus microcarpus]|nr:hypothetical protein BKA83DRAFT_4054058 [Pisolithus microcarpus]